MPVLAQVDLDAILAFVGEAASDDGTDSFSPSTMRRLRDLARADDIVFSELDRVRQRTLKFTTIVGTQSFDEVDESRGAGTYWDLRRWHPVCAYHERTRDWRALRVCDFMSRRKLLRSRLYADWFRPQGIATEMTAGLDAPNWHTKVFLFRRVSGDFSERDRTVIDVLRPLLARLYEATRSRQRLADALRLVGDRDAAGGVAVVLLDSAGRPDFVSGPARTLFARLGARPGRLPPAVEAKLNERLRLDLGNPTVVSWQGVEVVVRRSGEALLFEERLVLPTLTRRERQILELVAAGRTNAQVAEELLISPGTVRRHLENAFAKLRVHTRTEAVAHIRGYPLRH